MLVAARHLFELEKLERLEFVLCMADQVLGKQLDCSGQEEHLTEQDHLAEQRAVRLVEAVAAAEGFEDPLEVPRCCNFAVVQT